MVGLSGGVDSAVAALLLQRAGHQVCGLFMKNWDEDDGTDYCTAAEDYADAQKIAERIGIELDSINFAAEYWERVFAEFLRDYEAGYTPNPDVLCNREIKFGLFVDYVEQLGVRTIATGHYARGEGRDETFELFRAADLAKDQTYFLSCVPRLRLGQCLFPLANHTKTQVRQMAKCNGLHVSEKKDSTGICFIGERRFNELLERYIRHKPGEIVDAKGRILGEHIGLAYYTFGQRKGLAIGGKQDAREAPWYVMEKLEDSNRLVVTQNQNELMNYELEAIDVNWLVDDPSQHVNCQAMVRYRQPPAPCEYSIERNNIRIRFDSPQRAVTPGQFVVLYQDDKCLGGARISRVMN